MLWDELLICSRVGKFKPQFSFILILLTYSPLSSVRKRNPPSRGTDDVTGFGDDYVTAARGLLDAWVNSPGDLAEGALQPFQNAENLAAAATGRLCSSASFCGLRLMCLRLCCRVVVHFEVRLQEYSSYGIELAGIAWWPLAEEPSITSCMEGPLELENYSLCVFVYAGFAAEDRIEDK